MPKLKERRLADFVRSPASDAQLLELWSRVEGAEVRRHTSTRQLRLGAAAAALVGVLFGSFVLTRSPEPASVAAQPASATSDAPRQLALADGSQLVLSTGARARVLTMRADEVRVRLEHGQVRCEVAPDRGRRFVVEAGEFEVVVTGTRFTVDVEGEAANASSVAVSVEHGSVQVWELPHRLLAALGAGQRWASARPSPAPARAPDAGSATRVASAPPVPARASAPTSSPSVARPSVADPSTLLARASAARQAGKLPEAVSALTQLIQRHPEDERAGYAAFLRGRIQLDSLGDPPAAVESFSFAAAHPGSGFFPEDAEARRIEALARAGQMTECAGARDRFLAMYPGSARAKSMQGACRAD